MAFLSIGSGRVKNDYICRGYDIPYEPIPEKLIGSWRVGLFT